MTREMVKELLAKAGRNLEIREVEGGFWAIEQGEEEWVEIFPGVDMEELMDSIIDQLEESALSVSGDVYRYYDFDDFTVVWGSVAFDD